MLRQGFMVYMPFLVYMGGGLGQPIKGERCLLEGYP